MTDANKTDDKGIVLARPEVAADHPAEMATMPSMRDAMGAAAAEHYAGLAETNPMPDHGIAPPSEVPGMADLRVPPSSAAAQRLDVHAVVIQHQQTRIDELESAVLRLWDWIKQEIA